MFESIFSLTTGNTTSEITWVTLLSTIFCAFVLGTIVSFMYMKTHRDKMPSQSFAVTLVMLPAIISVIILLVGTDLARAFSLAGIFAIIRFRSAPGDPRDIAQVLMTMAVGLACGMGMIGFAALITVSICAVMLFFELINFGNTKNKARILKILIPENLDYQDVFDDIMKQYTKSYSLSKVRTTDLGSLFELVYVISLKRDVSEKEFIDEIRCRNGNLSITLVLNAQTGEY